MHFILPQWLRHGRDARGSAAAIFSVDIQPYGHRLATAGQDAAVKLWALPVLAALAAPPPGINKNNGSSRDGRDVLPADEEEVAAAARSAGSEPAGIGTSTGAAATTQQQQTDHIRVPGGARLDRDHPAPDGALLASVTGHAAAVNCVRWNPAGTLLASGGDDAVVLIYERCAGGEARSSRAFGGGAGGSAGQGGDEDWRVRRPLRAHAADVTDVCWSPDGERLASASIDNTIGIWSVRGESLIVQLRGHTGLVKGVAWDPVGRFLASQSDDRSAIVWRTADWAPEKVITDPFSAAIYPQNANVFYLRCSWSPCGSQLLTTNGFKPPGADVAPMFSRTSGFEKHIDLVGHELPVVATRFSQRLYRCRAPVIPTVNSVDIVDGTLEDVEASNAMDRDEGKNDKPTVRHGPGDGELPSSGLSTRNSSTQEVPYTCLALGSKDSGASIWQATGDRAFFNMTEIFTQEVIDLSWGTDGYTLVACSPDGGFVYVRFDPSELGDVVPIEEEREILAKQWRDFGGARDGAPLPETPAIVVMEKSRRLSAQPLTSPVIVPSTDPEPVLNTVDRISTPISLPVPALRQGAPDHTPPADPKVLAAQKEGRDRSGKRRIIPASVTPVPVGPESYGYEPASQPPPQPNPLKRIRVGLSHDHPGGRQNGIAENGEHHVAFPSTVSTAANGDGVKAETIGANGRADRTGNDGTGHAGFPGSERGAGAGNHVSKISGFGTSGAVALPATPIYKPSIIGLSTMLLPDSSSKHGRCRAIDNDIPPTILELREQHGSSRGGGTMVVCSKGGVVQWRDYHPLESPIAALAGVAGKFAAVGTSDGLLFLYSAASGRRLAPPIVLDSPPHSLEAQVLDNGKWFLLVITRSGLCSVYDVREKKLVCARSAAPLLARPVDAVGGVPGSDDAAVRTDIHRNIANARVTWTGEPILTLSDSHVFAYSRDLAAWIEVAGGSAPNSEFARELAAPGGAGIVRSLQASGASSHRVPSLSGMSGLRRAAIESLAHLETLLECSLALSSAVDYRYYLATYASKLVSSQDDDVESAEKRIRELCDSLLQFDSPPHACTILGLDSRALLRDVVLPIVSSNLSLQRIVSEYSESLDELKQRVPIKINSDRP